MSNNKNKIETLTSSYILGEDTWDITLFKHTEKGRSDLILPHKHDFYLLLFIEKGTGRHDIDFNQIEVKEYQIHFLRPQQVHYWQLSADTQGHQLMFSKLMLNSFQLLSPLPFFYIGMPFCLTLTKEEYLVIKNKLIELEDSLKGKTALQREISLLLFHLVLKKVQLYYLQYYSEEELKKVDAKIQEFEILLEEYFHKQSNVAFYAQKLNITPNYLNIRSKKALGLTASELIHNRIILEAKRLLTTTSVSIKEIAYYLSFNDTSYFNNFFKKHVSLTPGEFRSSYNNYNNQL